MGIFRDLIRRWLDDKPTPQPDPPPTTGKVPLLLVHGLFGSSRAWPTMINALIKNGYESDDIFTVDMTVDNNKLCSKNHLEVIRDKIEQICYDTGFDAIDVLGHSRGSLNLYQYICAEGTSRIRNFVSIAGAINACPNLYPKPSDPTPPPTLYTSIWSTDDGNGADKDRTYIEGCKHIKLSGVTHMTIKTDPIVIPYIIDALNGGGSNNTEKVVSRF